VLGRLVDIDPVSKLLQQVRKGFPDGFVVVNDCHQRRFHLPVSPELKNRKE